METPAAVILYSRTDCHLCEHVGRMLDDAGAAWRVVDIDADPRLAARYGLVIPVVRLEATGRELAFPFDAELLKRFLEG